MRGTLEATACSARSRSRVLRRRRGQRDEVDGAGGGGGHGEVLLRGRGRGRGEEERGGEAVVGREAARELHEGDEVAHARAAQEQHARPRHGAQAVRCATAGRVRGESLEWSARAVALLLGFLKPIEKAGLGDRQLL